MIRKATLLLSFCLSLSAFSETEKEKAPRVTPDSTSVLSRYERKMERLVLERDSAMYQQWHGAPNAYFYQLLTPATLYQAPLYQMMSKSPDRTDDAQIRRINAINRSMAELYVREPWLVVQTEAKLREQNAIRSDVVEKLETKDKLSEKVSKSTLLPEVDDKITVVTRRPNFWKINGSSSLHFQQNYYSENWFQGNENKYSGNLNFVLRVAYNNQKKVSLDNTVEAQLGFQTSKSDQKRAFRPTNNMLRNTFNLGIKAYKTLYYSTQVRLQTQIVPNYKFNTDIVESDILSPMDVTIAPGMKYDIAYGKKKRYTGYLNVAPLAYNIRYCQRDELVTRYGITQGHHSTHNFGPNITLNTTWKISDQITWNSNLYWFSNLHYTRVEWTNKIDFSVTKLISTTLYIYPRYDDSNPRYREMSKHDTYFMFQEWFSMGLNYIF